MVQLMKQNKKSFHIKRKRKKNARCEETKQNQKTKENKLWETKDF
jgi:hypothetical protein